MPAKTHAKLFMHGRSQAVRLPKEFRMPGKVTEGMDLVDALKRGEPVKNPDKIVKVQMAANAK